MPKTRKDAVHAASSELPPRPGSKGALTRASTLPPPPASYVASQLRFPVLALLSLTVSSALYAATSGFSSGELATVSRHRDEWWEISGVLGFKVAELAVGWYGDYDSADVTALMFLSDLPHLYFLTSFYAVRPTTMWTCLIIDAVSTGVPFYLLRSYDASHKLESPKGLVANRSVINDYGVQILTSLLAAGIYGLVIFGSFGSWLPVFLVTHFDGIRDISALYDRDFPHLVAALIPIGIAAKIFLFTPATAAKPDASDEKFAHFNPETASLRETVIYNFWGHSKRTRTLILRTATLVVVGGLHTWVQTHHTVEGAESIGAAGWSSVWAAAAILTSAAYWWVGDVEGMSN